jgi:hypothetical protein
MGTSAQQAPGAHQRARSRSPLRNDVCCESYVRYLSLVAALRVINARAKRGRALAYR